MGDSRQGVCHICGKHGKLTFEHIPPYAAFNDKKIKKMTGEQLITTQKEPWDTTEMSYVLQQRGAGAYSLCGACNNNTGHWYGSEYTKFILSLAKMTHENAEAFIINEYTHLELYKVKPLPIIKQMLSMFCSINKEDFIDENLREFLLNPKSNALDKKKYCLCMYLTNDKFIRYAGKTVLFKIEGPIIVASEISFFPVGLILYLNPDKRYQTLGCDITSFSDCEYDTEYTIEFSLPVYERNTFFPLDYRSKEEIEDCIRNDSEYLDNKKDDG